MRHRMSSLPRKRLLMGLLSAAGGASLLLSWLVFGRGEPADLPPIGASEFLNTQASAVYVGSQRCAECHTDQHDSYLQTTHSRSIFPVDPKSAPDDAEFYHSGSHRQYRVYRKDGKLHHAEIASLPGAGDFPLSDQVVQWAIGSGRTGSSYAALLDGFVVQSPVSWYTSRKRWDVTPGSAYEGSQPLSFAKPVTEGCLLCHTGQVEYPHAGLRDLILREEAIGCERCHGPGSLHVERRSNGESAAGEKDLTIVHPGRLERDRLEAVCGQCHLDTVAHVDLRGRRMQDFRPGQRLEDYRVYFGLGSGGHGSLRITSHIQQLHESRCYQRNEKLTCSTCHEAHAPQRPKTLLDYRVKCLECHNSQACGLPEAERRERQRDDNCLTCHMPRSPIEVAHVAFTNHRIGIHGKSSAESLEKTGPIMLQPWSDVTGLPKLEVDRCLGLAYHGLANSLAGEDMTVSLTRAKETLLDVRSRGLRDAAVDWALADIFQRQRDGDRAMELAESALAEKGYLKAVDRARTWMILSQNYLERGEKVEAHSALEKVIAIYPIPAAYYNLAVLRRNAGNLSGALDAARHAAALAPASPQHHELLAELCERLGLNQESLEHARCAAAMAQAQRAR